MAFLSGSDGQNVQRAVGFVDANYANVSDLERKSNTGYIFYLYGCPICWKSKLQPITATSTHEAELIACATASAEALWIRKLLIDLGFAVGLRPAVIEPKGRMKEALQLDGQSISDEDYQNDALQVHGDYHLDALHLFNDNLGTVQTINLSLIHI